MRTRPLAAATGSAALLLSLLASAASAQESSRQAPSIRVYSQYGAGVVSNYVEPAIEVSEDAYVFAVMMDLDERIQVLHPDDPGISVRLRSNRQLRLPNFFAGFNAPMQRGGRYTSNGLSYGNAGQTGDDTRGTVIAIASRAPFNLRLIEADGDWDISEIRRLIEYRSPSAAAQALARYLGAKGEPIGRDYMRFAGQGPSYYAYDNYAYDNYAYDNYYNNYAYCGYGYGYGSLGGALSIANALNRNRRNSTGYRPVVIGYDACGFPVIVAAQVRPGGGIRQPMPRRPRHPGDTTVFPKARLPIGISRTPPRHADGEAVTVPVGVFPLPQSTEPQPPDGTFGTSPRRAAPQAAPDGLRSQPSTQTHSVRQPPVERARPQAEPASAGVQPGYRYEPRVIERVVPTRAPERIPEPARTPAPVIHERPSAPPPRAEPAPAPRPAPTRTERAAPPPKNQ